MHFIQIIECWEQSKLSEVDKWIKLMNFKSRFCEKYLYLSNDPETTKKKSLPESSKKVPLVKKSGVEKAFSK